MYNRRLLRTSHLRYCVLSLQHIHYKYIIALIGNATRAI